MSKIIEFQKFLEIDIRVGTIVKAEINNSLNIPSVVMKIDFGKNIGFKKSSAHLIVNYSIKELINKQIAAVVNFKPKQIGNLISEVLVLGFPDENHKPILVSPDKKIKNGERLY